MKEAISWICFFISAAQEHRMQLLEQPLFDLLNLIRCEHAVKCVRIDCKDLIKKGANVLFGVLDGLDINLKACFFSFLFQLS